MSKNNNEEPFGGFGALSDILSGGTNIPVGDLLTGADTKDPSNLDDDKPKDPVIDDIGDDIDDDFTPPKVHDDKDDKDDNKKDDKDTDDTIDDKDDKKDTKDDKDDKSIDDDTSKDDTDDSPSDEPSGDLGEYEEDISVYLKEKLESMGLTFEEDLDVKSVEDVAGYLAKIVEENSEPVYPTDEVRELAKYVENGGDLKNFYDKAYSGIDTEVVDITNESDQRAIVAEDLKNKGYNKIQIDRKLKRYEDTGVLEDEATESIDAIKEYNKKIQEKLLDDNKKQSEQTVKQQQKFVDDVQNSIKSIKDVVGIPISNKERREISDYIFKRDVNGFTENQLDFQKDPIVNLIENAFFQKNKDVLLDKIKVKQESDVTKKFKKKLENTKDKKAKNSSGRQRSSSDDSISLSSLGKIFN